MELFPWLPCIGQVQENTTTVLCSFGMELVYVERHKGEQQLGEDVPGTPAKEAAKAVVFLEHPKGALGLNGAVHPQHNAVG